MNGDGLIELAFGKPLQEALDTDGRYLGEHVASGYADKDAERVLLFRDPRDATGRPTNVASLDQVVSSWSTVLHLLAAPTVGARPDLVHMLHAARTPAAIAIGSIVEARTGAGRLAGGSTPTSARPSFASDTASALESASARGADSASEPDDAHARSVPAPLSAAYKATIGYGQVLRTWILDGQPSVAPEVHAFLAVLDAQGWLIGAHHVCPGSRRAIAEAYCVLLGQDPSDFASAPEPIDGRDAADLITEAEPLARALAEVEALLFALHLQARLHPPVAGSPLHHFVGGPGRLGVILQLADYSTHADPTRAFGLVSPSDVVREFVAKASEANADPAECFAKAASVALAPLGRQVTPEVLRRLRVAD